MSALEGRSPNLKGTGVRDLYYDRNGRPITIEEFGRLFEDYGYKVIEKTPMVLGDDTVEVSTVWLGVNHSFGPGVPVIFETMVFGGAHDGDCERYCTEASACEGHDRIVAMLAAEHAEERS